MDIKDLENAEQLEISLPDERKEPASATPVEEEQITLSQQECYRQFDFFEEKSNKNETPRCEDPPISLPFPPEDYNKAGALKKVRGRILKKLLKREIKFYLPLVLVIAGLLLFSALVLSLCIRTDVFSNKEANTFVMIVTITSALVFMFSCVGGMSFAVIYPMTRYNKNFFQNEGYLTFSVPASMEEHVLAKRISAVLCSMFIGLVVIIGVVLLLLIGTGTSESLSTGGQVIENLIWIELGHFLLFFIEIPLLVVTGFAMAHGLCGAGSCLLSKKSEKGKTLYVVLIIFVANVLMSVLLPLISTLGIPLIPTTIWGFHLSSWLNIFLQGGVAVGCYFFEVYYLKNKLDLK